MRLLSLFSGIGAFDYGIEKAGMTVVGQCECDPFCLMVLEKHWPDVRRWTDVRTLSGDDVRASVGSVDLIAGGFPCQPHSTAGKRQGKDDERHLWPHFNRLIGELRPTWVVAENVPGLRTTAADEVLGDLEGQGYACGAFVVGAGDVGAPHKRKRVWIVGNASSSASKRNAGRLPAAQAGERGPWQQDGDMPVRLEYAGSGCQLAHAEPDGRRPGCGIESDEGRERIGRDQSSFCGPVADANEPGLARRRQRASGAESKVAMPSGGYGYRWPSRPGEPQHEWERPRLTQFGVGSATDGTSSRLVRLAKRANREALRAAGNAVVWQIPYLIGRWIKAGCVPAA